MCTDANCKNCNGDIDTCKRCGKGYKQVNGACVSKQDLKNLVGVGCDKFTSTNDVTTCNRCKRGYFKNADNECTKCEIENCVSCGANTCNRCAKGFT
jgi:hypothetical protein